MEKAYIISCFITFLIVFTQALLVLGKSKRIILARSWFLVSVFVSVMIWSFWGLSTSTDLNQALFYRYILDLGLIFFPVFHFRFMVIFLRVKEKYRKHLWGVFSLAVLLTLLNFIPFFRKTLYSFPGGFEYWPGLNIIYILALSFLVGVFGYSLYLASKKYNEVSGVIQNQIRYLVPAISLGVLGGLLGFWPFLLKFAPTGNILMSLSVIIIALALLKYPLPSGKKMARIIYVYVFVSVFAYLFFHLVSFVDVGYFGGVYTNKALIVGAVFAVLFSLVLLPFLTYVQETADILFFHGKNPYKIIKDLSLKFNDTLEIKSLLKTIKKEFKDILKAEEVKLVIFDPAQERKVWGEYSSAGLNVKKDSPFVKIRQIKVWGKLKKDENRLRKQMEDDNIRVAVPLRFQESLVGLILLGGKFSNQGYTEGDLDFLEAIAPQTAVAIHNALIYQKVEDLNSNLEKKIEEKTEDIQEKTNKLKKMLANQSEFLNIAGQQLRTPVSVIKGMLSMVREDEISKKKKKEFLDSILQNAFKLEEIIETMLTASEVDSGSFGFDLGPVQLKPLLKDIRSKQKGRAKEHGVKFKMNIPEKYLMPVLSNERYLKQVIENLVDNAFQYTKEGGSVTVKVRPKKDNMEIDVMDTGIGIPKKEIDNLFGKFSRANNAVNVYGNGSGLGLFVVKKIIDAHTKDAKVYIKESEVNKGTTFTVSLPTVRDT